ncbi:MAG TPA: type I-D CRISPR-associated protein Cas10d/Csc3, partial [Ktedonobacterales bacterium]
MWHQDLLNKVIARDPIWAQHPALGEVVRRFTSTLCPTILQYFAGRAALGGAGTPLDEAERAALPEGARPLTAEEYERFGRSHADQSLATHLLNGAFAGFRLAALLPDAFPWTERQWNLWTLAFVLHDYGKARGVDVPASRLDTARVICRHLGQQLDFDAFFPKWGNYLDDIVYLAQNVQKIRGSNLNLRDYDLRLHPTQLEPLRLLASFADVLVHVTEPRDVAAPSAEDGRQRHVNLRVTLQALLAERAPRLAYHQMAETRGLLTNLLHNAMREAFLRQGFTAYLYFADGVVYLAPPNGQAQIAVEDVAERAWGSIREALTKSESFGLGRDGKGIKIAPPLYQFLSPGELIEAGRSFALSIKNNIADKRLEKYGAVDPGLLADLRIDQLAEFLAFLKRNIAEVLLPQVKDLSAFLLGQLGLGSVVSVAEVERNEGGVPLGWYYGAAHYITRRPTLTPEDLDVLMRQLGGAFLAELRRQGLPAQGATALKDALTSYISKILDIDGAALTGEHAPAQFSDELTSYLHNKASNRPVCSLCSSPYENEEQTVTVVLFKPQQYSNKNRLGGSRVVRGVCPICSLEMLLRQATQGAPGGKFQ